MLKNVQIATFYTFRILFYINFTTFVQETIQYAHPLW